MVGWLVTLSSPKFFPSSLHNLVLQSISLAIHKNDRLAKFYSAENEEEAQVDDQSSDTTDGEDDQSSKKEGSDNVPLK